MKTKFPIKLKDTLFPAGTEVRLATLQEMQAVWSEITVRKGSPQVGVWFPGIPVPTIIHNSQLDVTPVPTWGQSGTEATVRCGPGPD